MSALSPVLTMQQSLGQRLLAGALITPEQLDEALALQAEHGTRLGETLLSMGVLRGDHLAAMLAGQHGLVTFDPALFRPKEAVYAANTDEWYREQRVLLIPAASEQIQVVTADPFNQDLLSTIEQRVGCPVEPLVASERDMERVLDQVHRETNLQQSIDQLREKSPADSAHIVLTQRQKVGLVLLLALLACSLVLNWSLTLTTLVSGTTLAHLCASLYRLYLLRQGWDQQLAEEDESIDGLGERDLPVYTILVPLYREAVVLPQLTAAIQALDWPKAKLDVRILLEEDDTETIAAARTAGLPSYFTLVIVPPGGPQGKPKACNYGLAHARGEYVVIFDAEDIPESDQLKKVYARFRSSPPTLGCVQCRLNFYNPEQNLLTRWFTCEYSMWFDLFLPGLQRIQAPIPLGGTSNHFRRTVLEKLAAWDPYNVTEDADLGARLFKEGYRTTILDSTTFEEANPRVGNWIRQRSRWIKGYIVTWLVHMRHPVRLWQQLGPRGFFHFQLMIGGNGYVLLLNPVYWLLTVLWFPTHAGWIAQLFPGPIYYLAAIALFAGNFSFVYAMMVGAFDRQRYRLVKFAMLSPLYWVLMSIAAWKAFLQLFYAPNYWEKTVHGLATTPALIALQAQQNEG